MKTPPGAGLPARLLLLCTPLLSASFAFTFNAQASDHADTPALAAIPRHDARLTDLHAFTNGADLVLAVSTNPMIPTSATSYTWPSDLSITIHIDNNAKVDHSDPAFALFGGKIHKPNKIKSEVELTVTFPGGIPTLSTDGIESCDVGAIQLFAGLRDDPFIRGPRQGRNIAALVLQLPVDAVRKGNKPMLIWATSKVAAATFASPIAEHVGRSFRSQLLFNDAMNTQTPSDQATSLEAAGLEPIPDVMVLDLALPVGFPNGRLLTDDVVDIVGDPASQANDTPFPTANDLPFLPAFPYLALPHPAP